MQPINVDKPYQKIKRTIEDWLYIIEINVADVVSACATSFNQSRVEKNYRVKRMFAETFQLHGAFSSRIIPYIEGINPFQYLDEESVKRWVEKIRKDGAIPQNVDTTKLAEELFNRMKQYPLRVLEQSEKEEIKQRLRAGEDVEKLATEYFIDKQRVIALKAVTRRKS